MADPHEQDLETIYRTRFAGKTEYRRQVWQVLAAYFAQWIPRDGSTLDLGAGYCEFINQVNCATKYAMDLNPEVQSRANPGVTVLLQDCSELWPLPEASLDTVFTSNFLEHLPDKAAVRRTFLQIFSRLKPGGRLIALGPNIKYLPGAYWDFFDHYVELTELSLTEGLTNCGFSIERQIDRFLPYTMSQGSEPPVWMLQLYVGLPLVWRFFGKQFLVIARKP